MSNPLETARRWMHENADPQSTRYGWLSDEEVSDLMRLMNAYTWLALNDAHVIVGLPPQRPSVARN